ncbi:hypothetical protein DVH24_004886 [Malus domestica]|uniref:Uncharacterized protein n=1 Tax=Malus domestica TaxID=3750 RepID=A0A498IFQ3_MALDO|nr:hypothetical protein DVH24_004886 [Malus domestica]
MLPQRIVGIVAQLGWCTLQLGSNNKVGNKVLFGAFLGQDWICLQKFGKIYGLYKVGDKGSSSVSLDLKGTRRFFNAFFDREPHYRHVFWSSRLLIPDLLLFWLSLFYHAYNASRIESMAKGTPPMVKMINNLIQDRVNN